MLPSIIRSARTLVVSSRSSCPIRVNLLSSFRSTKDGKGNRNFNRNDAHRDSKYSSRYEHQRNDAHRDGKYSSRHEYQRGNEKLKRTNNDTWQDGRYSRKHEAQPLNERDSPQLFNHPDSLSDFSSLLTYFRSKSPEKIKEEIVLQTIKSLTIESQPFLQLSKSSNNLAFSAHKPLTFANLNSLLYYLIYNTRLRRYKHRSLKSFLYQCISQTEEFGQQVADHQYELVNFLRNCGRLGCRWNDLEQSEQDLIQLLINRIDKSRCETSFTFYAQYVAMLGELEYPLPTYKPLMLVLLHHNDLSVEEIEIKDLDSFVGGFGRLLSFKKDSLPPEIIPIYRKLLLQFFSTAFHRNRRVQKIMPPSSEVFYHAVSQLSQVNATSEEIVENPLVLKGLFTGLEKYWQRRMPLYQKCSVLLSLANIGFTFGNIPPNTATTLLFQFVEDFQKPDIFCLQSSINALGKMGYTFETLPDEFRERFLDGLNHLFSAPLNKDKPILSSKQTVELFTSFRNLQIRWSDIPDVETTLMVSIEVVTPQMNRDQIFRLIDSLSYMDKGWEELPQTLQQALEKRIEVLLTQESIESTTEEEKVAKSFSLILNILSLFHRIGYHWMNHDAIKSFILGSLDTFFTSTGEANLKGRKKMDELIITLTNSQIPWDLLPNNVQLGLKEELKGRSSAK